MILWFYLQRAVTIVMGSATIPNSKVIVSLSLNKQVPLTKFMNDRMKARPCIVTSSMWLDNSLMSRAQSSRPSTRNWLIKVEIFIIIRGMEQTQAWTIRKEFESNLDVSDSRKEENIDRYKCHKYLKWKINIFKNIDT